MRRSSIRSRIRLFIGGCLAAALACNLPIGTQQQGTATSSAPQREVAPLLVTISKPKDGATYPLFSPIVIHAETQGDATIASYELWVDGALLKSEKTNFPIASLDWSVTEGNHTLYVRAVDVNGNAGISNSIRMKASESPSRIATFYTAQDGDTLESIAVKYAMQPQSLLQLNSSLNASAPIPSGAEIKVIITTNALSLSSPSSSPPNVTSQPAESQPAEGYSPSPYQQFWDSVLPQSEPPTAPTIQVSADASVNGCAAKVFITDTSDSEAGFYLYRLDDSSQFFKRVATLSASDGKAPLLYLDPDLGGTVNYYAAAFNLAGEVAGAPAGFVFDKKSCGSAFWNGAQPKGNFDINNIDAAVSYDKTYVYLSVNGGQNLRVPKDPKQFFIPENKVFDLAGEIKKIALEEVAAPGQQITLDIDVWGWQGGTLVHIGTYQKILTGPEGEVASPSALQVCSSDPCYENKNSDVGDNTNKSDSLEMVQLGNTQFEWKKPADYQQGLWQVSDAPMNSSDCSINGFLNTGYVNGGGESAFFNIDLSPFNDPPFTDPVALLLLKQSKPYYVRVLPIVNGQPLCQPTNEVSIIKIPPPAPLQFPQDAPTPPTPFDVQIVSYQPIQYPNPAHARCVTVQENVYFGLPDNSPVFQSWLDDYGTLNPSWVPYAWDWRDRPVDPNTGWCPPPYEESTWDVVEGYLESAVNFISDLYNTLKEALVTFVSITMNQVCTAAKIAKATGLDAEGGETAEKATQGINTACDVVAEIAVDVGLTYVGLPPSLPNYDELKESAKGHAVDLIAEKMFEATGVPCDDSPMAGVPVDPAAVGGPHIPSCKELIRKALDAVEQEMNNAVHEQSCMGEEEAHAIGIEPMCIPPGVTVTPMSDGLLLPAAIVVKVTRRADVPESAMPDPGQFKTSCYLSISSSAKNTSPKDGAPISGTLFKNINQSLSLDIVPGKPEQFAFVLNPNSVPFDTNDPNSYPNGGGFWLPGHLQALKDQYAANNWNSIVPGGLLSDDWPSLFRGGTITLTASAACVTNGEGFTPSNSSASDVWNGAASQDEK